jgi:hypothetical protein
MKICACRNDAELSITIPTMASLVNLIKGRKVGFRGGWNQSLLVSIDKSHGYLNWL